jgi:hypothetical protein
MATTLRKSPLWSWCDILCQANVDRLGLAAGDTAPVRLRGRGGHRNAATERPGDRQVEETASQTLVEDELAEIDSQAIADG